MAPFVKLFKAIYETSEIPEQWLIAKIIPIYKKGESSNISNNKQIANLYHFFLTYFFNLTYTTLVTAFHNPDKLTNDLLVFNLIDIKQIISPDRFDPERDHIICPTIMKGRDMKD